jgi:hypothetical protein
VGQSKGPSNRQCIVKKEPIDRAFGDVEWQSSRYLKRDETRARVVRRRTHHSLLRQARRGRTLLLRSRSPRPLRLLRRIEALIPEGYLDQIPVPALLAEAGFDALGADRFAFIALP